MTMMKAIAARHFGGPEVLNPLELEVPSLEPCAIRIATRATSVNPIDTKIRSGAVAVLADGFPWVPGFDLAGVVDAVCPGIADLEPGMRVMAFAKGAAGEFALADARLTVPIPDGVSDTVAGCLPVVGLTAWEAVVRRARIRPGDRVLVHGGCGGVGHLVVQLAAISGGRVFATVSTEEKAAMVTELGAEAAILYRDRSVEDYVADHTDGFGFETVIDTVGGANLVNSFAAVAPFGTVVTIAARAMVDLSPLHAKAARFEAIFVLLNRLRDIGVAEQGKDLRRLVAMVAAGDLRLLCDPRPIRIESLADGHARIESGDVVGKLPVRCDWTG